MEIAILGFGREGKAAYNYWHTSGNRITVCDKNETINVPAGVRAKLGTGYLDNLDSFDLIVRSPGLHPQDILQANPKAVDILDKVTSGTNEFLRVCPTKNVVGITGTKGKGTTSTLLASMLEAGGKKVYLGGNIGIPAIELLSNNIKPDDWVVLELSNFQLIDLHYSPQVAVCLLIEPEHLNWHSTIDAYVDAKKQLFRHQAEGDIAVYYAPNHYSQAVAGASPGVVTPYMAPPGAEVIERKIVVDGTTICGINDIKLLGTHNWQNVCAAATVAWHILQDVVPIKKAITSFVGLPHRLEFVREIDGVRYYNDSFASAPTATIAALSAIPGTKLVVAGGFDRGLDLSELARTFLTHQDEIRRAVLIGASAERLSKVLQAHGFTNYDVLKATSLKEIIDHVRSLVWEGDSVVFSPGFPSFDMFNDFEDRGIQYKTLVNQLT